MGAASRAKWSHKQAAAAVLLSPGMTEEQKRNYLRQFKRPEKLFPGNRIPDQFKHLLEA